MSNSASIAAAKKRRSQQINPIISSKIKNNNIQNAQDNQNNEINQSRQKITPLQLLAQHDQRLFYLETKEKNNNDITNINSLLYINDYDMLAIFGVQYNKLYVLKKQINFILFYEKVYSNKIVVYKKKTYLIYF